MQAGSLESHDLQFDREVFDLVVQYPVRRRERRVTRPHMVLCSKEHMFESTRLNDPLVREHSLLYREDNRSRKNTCRL